jgi:hypothetical protein
MLAPLVTLGVFAMVLGMFVWVASNVRRRGVGSSFMGPFQEQWDPAHYRSQIEIHQQQQRRAPTPAPGDPPWLDELRGGG